MPRNQNCDPTDMRQFIIDLQALCALHGVVLAGYSDSYRTCVTVNNARDPTRYFRKIHGDHLDEWVPQRRP